MPNTKNGMIEKELALKLLENMQLARKFEERIADFFHKKMLHGTTHLGIGEEAVSAGVCAALEQKDQIFASHRGHNQVICKGIDVKQIMAEMFAKKTGCCKGKGGSMHLADIQKGVLGTNGILGPTLPLACGAALTHKKKKDGIITAVFFGEGATNEGAFHEAFNLASLWNLPVLFFCINNTYGMSTHISKAMKEIDLKKRALPFGIPVKEVDGNDVETVYQTALEARAWAAGGKGPFFMIENTYRISGHSKSDANYYRTQEEIDFWKKKCPIDRWKKTLLDRNLCTEQDLKWIDQKTTEEIRLAVQFAMESPYPALEEAYCDIYAEEKEGKPE